MLENEAWSLDEKPEDLEKITAHVVCRQLDQGLKSKLGHLGLRSALRGNAHPDQLDVGLQSAPI